MNVIWKYKLNWASDTLIEMSPNADILAVQMQDGEITMWVQLNTDESTTHRKFKILPTGYEFEPFAGKHLGTVQDRGFVWHAYEVY